MRTPSRKISSDQGSAYVLSLLVLAVLTVAGLSLSLVTQSEMQIGVNEKLGAQIFHAAIAGIDIGSAKALVLPDLRSFEIDLVEPTNAPGLNLRHRLQVSPFMPILSSPCSLCQINEGREFHKIDHAVVSIATRIGWMGNPADPPEDPDSLARERVSLLVSLQPWRADLATRVDAATDPRRDTLEDAF